MGNTHPRDPLARPGMIKVHQYLTRGWAPAKWAHHPKEIKDAIRAMRWRPGIKMCWANSQIFLIAARARGIETEYREGWCLCPVPVDHAWLIYKGKTLDLTLGPEEFGDGLIQYGPSYAVSIKEVAAKVITRGVHSPILPDKLSSICPPGFTREGIDKLHEHLMGGLITRGEDR